MKNATYWQKRMELLEDARHRDAVKAYQTVAQALDDAEREIKQKIEIWINRVAVNNEISYEQARKMLKDAELKEFKWDVDQYIKAGKEHAKTGLWSKELENASARAHISRLEGIQIELHGLLQNAYNVQEDALSGLLTSEYSDTYYKTAFEVQKGVGVGWGIGGLNEQAIQDVIQNPWSTDKRIFSDRIWTSQATVADELQREMLRMFATGSAPDAAIDHMTQFVGATVKNAKRRAGTLVMTESAAIGNKAQEDSFSDLGVEEYVVIATLDSVTCDECGDWDGKHFPMKDRKMGLNAPPFHPNCRCCTAPYFPDGQPSTRMARNIETGKSEYVDNMTYKEWKEKYVSGEQGIASKKVPKDDDLRINRDLIESNEYSKKFNGITGQKNVDDSILKRARSSLIHRDGTAREDLYIISAEDGHILGKNITSIEDYGVKPNDSIRKAIENNSGKIIGIHNHPDNTPPTGSDFEAAYYRKYKFGVTACANGDVYVYVTTDKFASAKIIDSTIQKFQKKIDSSGEKVYANDKEAHLAALDSLRKDYGIYYETR